MALDSGPSSPSSPSALLNTVAPAVETMPPSESAAATPTAAPAAATPATDAEELKMAEASFEACLRLAVDLIPALSEHLPSLNALNDPRKDSIISSIEVVQEAWTIFTAAMTQSFMQAQQAPDAAAQAAPGAPLTDNPKAGAPLFFRIIPILRISFTSADSEPDSEVKVEGGAQSPAEQAQAPAEQVQAPAEQVQAPAEQTQAPAEQAQAPHRKRRKP